MENCVCTVQVYHALHSFLSRMSDFSSGPSGAREPPFIEPAQVPVSAPLPSTDRRPTSHLGKFRMAISRQRVIRSHRRRSSVNFGGQDIFARKYMHEKITKCPNFTRFLPEKNSFCPIFFLGGGGATAPPAPRLLRLCPIHFMFGSRAGISG